MLLTVGSETRQRVVSSEHCVRKFYLFNCFNSQQSAQFSTLNTTQLFQLFGLTKENTLLYIVSDGRAGYWLAMCRVQQRIVQYCNLPDSNHKVPPLFPKSLKDNLTEVIRSNAAHEYRNVSNRGKYIAENVDSLKLFSMVLFLY